MRAWTSIAAAVAVAVGAGLTGMAVSGSDRDEAGAPGQDEADYPTTVEVLRRDLARTERLDGTVGHGQPTPLVLLAAGTITDLPEPGQIIEPGGVIAEVDGRPIVAVGGAFPFWRALGPGVSAGKDVLQVECLLATMGYAQIYDVTVDEKWTAATTRAVVAFQRDHGQDDDGEIGLGELVVVDAAVRVDDVAGVAGQPAAEAGITITSPERSVSVDLAVDEADLLADGGPVQVELPTGESVAGTVATIGAAETSETSGSTLPVIVTVSDGLELADGVPVEVVVEVVAAEGVLAVPVEAVLALAEGGYALEVAASSAADSAAATVDPATTAGTRLVGVTLGVFADGLVEVVGDIEAGARVVVP